MARNFFEMLDTKWGQGKFLCVGLDPNLEKIPESVRQSGTRETIVAFNRAIVDATHDLVCAFKPNLAFYEVHGDEGSNALRETIAYINEAAPDVPIVLDAKYADVDNSNTAYASAAFDYLRADAVTVNPYPGSLALAPFLDRADKGIIIWCRSSNKGAGEFQDLQIDGERLYTVVARNVVEKWNKNKNCALVVGATYPDELREIRALIGDMPILVPGIGAQNGDLETSVKAGKSQSGRGLILNASRAIIYASSKDDFAKAARAKAEEFHSAIKRALVE